MDPDWHNFKTPSPDPNPDLPHLLILGDPEFLGKHTAKTFIDTGWAVSILSNKDAQPLQHPRLTYIRCDRTNPESLKKTLERLFFDLTIDLESRSPEITGASLEVLFGRTSHHIHLSSDLVYSLCPGIPKPWREDNLTTSTEIPESSDPEVRQIFEAEIAVNKALLERGFPSTIVRATQTSGAGDPFLTDYVHILRIMDGNPLVVPRNSGLFRHVHVPDLTTAFLKIAAHRRETTGLTINVAGSGMIDLQEYYSLLACILGKPLKLLIALVEACEPFFAKSGYPSHYSDHRIPDITRFESSLGFTPRGFDKFLPRVVEYYLSDFKGPIPDAYTRLRNVEMSILKDLLSRTS
jgi:nucleoside-diphosphate-sugar epimerase